MKFDWRILGWILCLAFLSVGARNFEEGLSHDGPLYATIARNMANGGSWFRMDADIPGFIPFAEHPHLGFWSEAIIFKIFPAEDWSARILGHLYYVFFLGLLFFYVRRKSDELVATWAVVLLWSFHIFANVFSTFYLDPAVLVLGTLSVLTWEAAFERSQRRWFVVSGVFLALAAMVKGLTVCGFLPAYVVIAWLSPRRQWVKIGGVLFVVAFAAVAGSYFAAVRASDVPEFFDIYWSRQVTNRFARRWSLSGLWDVEYWRQLLRYTNYLLPIALWGMFRVRRQKALRLPLVLSGSFIFFFSTSGLPGGQYLIMVLPWLAWFIAEVVAHRVRLSGEGLRRFTGGLAIAALFIVQYIPFRTHGRGPITELKLIRELSTLGVKQIYLDAYPDPLTPQVSHFIFSAPFAWYGRVKVHYPESQAIPAATPGTGYYFRFPEPQREAEAKAKGWCFVPGAEAGSLFRACQ